MKMKAGLLALAVAALPCGIFARTLITPMDGPHGLSFPDGPTLNPEQAIRFWPARPRGLARLMLEKYGTPSRFNEHALYWYDNGPWQRTVVYRDALTHPFLGRGQDYLEQTVGYHVTTDGLEDLERFDERIRFDARTGALASRSESEELNFLALNLAVEILTHARSVEDAREAYRKMRRLAASGKSSSYLDGLAFEVQADKDSNHWNP